MSAARLKTNCRWLHDWAPWEILYRSDAQIDKRVVGVVLTQQRTCLRCGLTQVRVDTELA